MRDFIERIELTWCETMHTATMWPIRGKYRCGTCLREYKVAFDIPERPAAPSAVTATFAAARQSKSLAAAR